MENFEIFIINIFDFYTLIEIANPWQHLLKNFTKTQVRERLTHSTTYP